MLLKVFQPAEVVKAAMRKVLGQANRYIDVARIGLPAGRGAKQGNAHHADGAEFLFMRLQGANHLVAVHGSILPYLPAQSRPRRIQRLAGTRSSFARMHKAKPYATYSGSSRSPTMAATRAAAPRKVPNGSS